MKDIDSRRLAMLERLFAFGLNRREAFAPGSAGAKLFQQLERTIEAIRNEVTLQYSGHVHASGGKGLRTQARAELLAQLAAIRATTRTIAKQRRDVSDKFRKLRRPRDQDLLTLARSIAADVAPNERAFIDHNMPPTFLAELRSAIDQFEGVLDRRVAARTEHMTARTNIRLTMSAAATLVQQLDAVVVNALRRDEVAMKLWRRARRIPKPRGRPKARRRPAPES